MIKVRSILEEFSSDIIDVQYDRFLVTHNVEHLTPIIERLIPYKYCCTFTEYVDSEKCMTQFEPASDDIDPPKNPIDYLFE